MVGEKTLWERDKLLVTRIFTINSNVWKKVPTQVNLCSPGRQTRADCFFSCISKAFFYLQILTIFRNKWISWIDNYVMTSLVPYITEIQQAPFWKSMAQFIIYLAVKSWKNGINFHFLL